MINNKKALCLASMASNLDNFNRNNVKILQSLGYEVTLAANFNTIEDTNSQEKIKSFIEEMMRENVIIQQIDFTRHISNIKGLIKSYKQVKTLIDKKYELIHCHSPICAAITRLCAKKYQKKGMCKVIYTAHGFHFYNGAPIKNWLIYYPIEKLLSNYTDVIITINKEDYDRAKKKFKSKKTIYIPGIGVNTKKFAKKLLSENDITSFRQEKRRALNIENNSFVITSVGELNQNKNHSVIIKALKKCNDTQIHYIIVGQGILFSELNELIKNLGLSQQVHLLGYRSDVNDIYRLSDVCVFPSIREGLGLAAVEGMASSLPLIVSDNRGTRDFLNKDNAITCKYNDVDAFANAILVLKENRKLCEEMGNKNQLLSKKFDISVVECKMRELYCDLLN